MEETAALVVYSESRWKAGGRAAHESKVVVMCLVPAGGRGNGRSRPPLLKTTPLEVASVARWRGLWDPSTVFYYSLKLPIKNRKRYSAGVARTTAGATRTPLTPQPPQLTPPPLAQTLSRGCPFRHQLVFHANQRGRGRQPLRHYCWHIHRTVAVTPYHRHWSTPTNVATTAPPTLLSPSPGTATSGPRTPAWPRPHPPTPLLPSPATNTSCPRPPAWPRPPHPTP